MTKRKTAQPAIPAKAAEIPSAAAPKTRKPVAKPATPAIPDPPPVEIVALALLELGINKPWYSCRVVGGRLEFRLYGGDVLTWPVGAVREPPKGG